MSQKKNEHQWERNFGQETFPLSGEGISSWLVKTMYSGGDKMVLEASLVFFSKTLWVLVLSSKVLCVADTSFLGRSEDD